MSQPLDRTCTAPQLGDVDEEAGEFWIGNPFRIAAEGENLSAFERNRMYLNGGSSFIDGSFTSGADIDSDSRSVIATDFNRDGAVDLLVGSVGGGPIRLFLNRIPQQNRLSIRLKGTKSNRAAIGTRVVAKIGDRQVVRDAFGANGFMGQAPPEIDLGLGQADQVSELTVRWPSGIIQQLRQIDSGSMLITEPAH